MGSDMISGTRIAIGDAAVTAVLGYVVVFVGLVFLMCVVIATGKIMTSKAAKQSDTAAEISAAPVSAEPAPGSAGEVKLYGTSDRDAAMIMAIVADKTGKPLNELRFRSIREVK